MLRRSCSEAIKMFQRRCVPPIDIQQKRQEHIFRRMHPPALPEEGEEGWRLDANAPDGVPQMTHGRTSWVHVWDDDYNKFTTKGDEFVYIVDKNTNDDPVGHIDVILCWDIEGLGLTGDRIRLSRDLARHQLIPIGAACYVTAENVIKYKKIAEENTIRREKEGDTSIPEEYDRIMKMLEALVLPIPMNVATPWSLSKAHVRVALRRQGLWINEENIGLPDQETTNKSNPDLQIDITLHTRGGSIYRIIPVEAKIVARASVEARAKPFAQRFKYVKKTISELVVEKYKEMNEHTMSKQSTPTIET